jgi:hypothetical protein
MDMEAIVADNDKRLSVHEAVCAERYEGIQDAFTKGSKRMERIEYLLYAVIVSVFFGKDFLMDVVKGLIK